MPAIVTVTPYGKDGETLVGDEAVLYQSHGYAFVAADVRGRGKSEGDWLAFVNDAKDTHDVIEWAAAQPWCNGRVGTTGLSYMGWVQWAAASERPPHLRAMVSTSAAGRWQQEIPYTNGVFQLYFAWWAYSTRRRILDFYGLEHSDWDEILRTLPFEDIGKIINAAGPNWDDLCLHDTLDDFYRALRYEDRYPEIDVPCLHVTGGTTRRTCSARSTTTSTCARCRQPASRSTCWSARGATSSPGSPTRECGGSTSARTRRTTWTPSTCAGSTTGSRATTPVSATWIRSASSSRAATPGAVGPAGRSATRPRCCTSRRAAWVSSRRASRAADEFRYDPADPVPTGLDVRKYPFEDIPLDQTATEARDDVLCYTSEPVTEAVTVSGWATAELYASSDGDDTDWHVKLTDVTPDGRSLRVTQGCLRAACRDSLEEPAPLVPGETYQFNVELWPTHHVFLPGHRIRLTVTSSDFPWFARSLNRFGPVRSQAEPRVAVNTVRHGGASASRLVLPVEGAPAQS